MVDIEEQLLGTLLFNNDLIFQSTVNTEHFTNKIRQQGYTQIKNLVESGSKVDPIYLTKILNNNEPYEWYKKFTSDALYENLEKLLVNAKINRDLLKAVAVINSKYEPHQKIKDIQDILNKVSFGGGSEYTEFRSDIPMIIEDIEKQYNLKGRCSGIKTSLGAIDNNMSGIQSEYMIIAARPSVGKTAFILTLVNNIAKNNNVGIFSLEMPKIKLYQRLVSMNSNVSGSDIRKGYLDKKSFDKINFALSDMEQMGIYTNDTPRIGFAELKNQARKMVRMEGVKIIFIDYITLIKPENTDIPRHEQVSQISAGLQALQRELSIPIIALSQLTRDKEGNKPTLNSLRESGSLEQDADSVLFLHREKDIDEKYRGENDVIPISLIIAKNRNGSVCEEKLAFKQSQTKFFDYENNY